MKKFVYFILGIVFTVLITLVVVFYFSSKLSLSMTDSSSTAVHEVVDASVIEDYKLNKKIELIGVSEFDQLALSFQKPTIVVFWASWCGSCFKEIPTIKEYTKARDIDLVFVSFDKQNKRQEEQVVKKMKALGIDKTYQLNGEEGVFDFTNIKKLVAFLEERGIAESDINGLPINLVYKEGKLISIFDSLDYQASVYQAFDELIQGASLE